MEGQPENPWYKEGYNYPVDIDSDNEGNIYVLDRRDYIVKKHNTQGLLIKNIGERGQGPSEFQMPLSFCISLRGGVGERIHRLEFREAEYLQLSSIKYNMVGRKHQINS